MSDEERTLEEIARLLPKCELHTHLDGSLSPKFIAQRAAARGMTLPPEVGLDGTGIREYVHEMKHKQIEQGHRAEPGKNWSVFEFCNQFLQTHDELRTATIDILTRFHEENVKLCELRFCPTLHCLEGLTEQEATLAVVEGFVDMKKKCGMLGGVLLCGLRSHSPEETHRIAISACELKQATNGIVLGFDIAGDEGSFPIHSHMESIATAFNNGACVTVHAGEWPVDETYGTASVDNLRLVLDSGQIHRVGHGIQVVSDPELVKRSHKNVSSVCFECCLTANVGWKIGSYAEHPIRSMINSGLLVTLNCDNTLLSGSAERSATPPGEIVRFIRDVKMDFNDLHQVLMNGVNNSFVFKSQKWDEKERNEWVRQFEEQIFSVIGSHLTPIRSCPYRLLSP